MCIAYRPCSAPHSGAGPSWAQGATAGQSSRRYQASLTFSAPFDAQPAGRPPETSAARPIDAGSAQLASRSAARRADRPTDRPTVRPTGRLVNRPGAGSTIQPVSEAGRPTALPSVRPSVGLLADRPVGRPSGGPVSRAFSPLSGWADGRGVRRLGGRSGNRFGERLVWRAVGRSVE